MKSSLLILSFFLTGCAIFSSDPKFKTSETISRQLLTNERFFQFVGESSAFQLENSTKIDLLEIHSVLIEGTKDSMNKAVLIGEFSEKQVQLFCRTIIDDKLYDWDSISLSKTEFKPKYQIRIFNSDQYFSFMYSPMTNQFSRISLSEGQEVIFVKPEFKSKFESIIK